MKALKKFTIFLFFLVPILSLCGCYRVDPGTMSELKGTYELIKYYRAYPADEEGQSRKTDFIEEKKIQAYLVIDGSDFGYVVYKDEERETLCNRVYITYTYSQDDAEKVELIEYRTANTDETPIVERGKLGFRAKDKTLNQELPLMAFENNSLVKKYTDYTEYKRADKATDLSYVAKKLGDIPACADFALAPYDGCLRLEDPTQTPYIYYVMEIDAAAKNATVYYALKSDGQRVVKTEQTVSYIPGYNGISAESISVGEERFSAFLMVEGLQKEITAEEGFTVFLRYLPMEEDLETYIQQALDDYFAA